MENNSKIEVNRTLAAGDFIKTIWGWWGEIKEIREIKHGQGIRVKRLNDGLSFDIDHNDIEDFNNTCR